MNKIKSGRPVDKNKDKAILEAARKLLLESGPGAVSMERVAAKASVAKGTLYSRFANRHELLCAVATLRASSLTIPIETPPKSLDELQMALVEFVELLTNYLVSKDHLKLMETLASPSDIMRSEKENLYENGPQQTHTTLARYLESATKMGLIQCEKADDSAELLLGMMMGLDLVRAWYGMPLKLAQNDKQTNHALSIVTSFLTLHDCKAN